MSRRSVPFGHLTSREQQIMELIIAGRKTAEIVEELGISPFTLRTHRATILRRLGANHMGHAVALYLQQQEADAEHARRRAQEDAEHVQETWEAHHTIFGKGA